MPDTRLILGNITFADFEIPATINFGGKQRTKVHNLVGATRVIDALGPEPDDIKWSGRFRGANAASRARALDTLRISGAVVGLSWGSFARTVLVTHVKCDYQRFYEIPYEVTCMVVNGDGAGAGLSIGLAGMIASDLLTIVALGGRL